MSNPVSGHLLHTGNSPTEPAEPSDRSGNPAHACLTPRQPTCCPEPRTTRKSIPQTPLHSHGSSPGEMEASPCLFLLLNSPQCHTLGQGMGLGMGQG